MQQLQPQAPTAGELHPVIQGFQNENTLYRAMQGETMDDLHKRFDDAVANAQKEFGKTFSNIINGARLPGTGQPFQSTNPADTRQIIGTVQASTKEDVEKAIDAAEAAYPSWSSMDAKQRTKIVRAAGELLRKQKYEFAAWMTLENGKNRIEALNDVDEAIDFLTFYPHLVDRLDGFKIQMGSPVPNENCTSIRKPYGPWAVICPFNFPVAITIGMTAGAIVTGNTVVLKPAADTPIVAFKFVELLESAGLPKGVVNLVIGRGSVAGQALLDSRRIKGIVFTGSRNVGLRVMQSSIDRGGRPVIAEMGGKNPIIVTPNAEMDAAVEGVARSAFGFSGQKCSACSRVYVHESIKDEFTKRLVEWVKANASVGDPTLKETFVGPLINQAAQDKYLRGVEEARKDGTMLLDGGAMDGEAYAHGFFVKPAIVDGLADDHFVTRTELFSPLLSVYAYHDLEDAVRRANDAEYGLTAGIFSRDAKEQAYFFDTIQSGVTYSNRRSGGSTAAVVAGQSFVGWKNSGNTGNGAGGVYYLYQFTREQSQTRCT